MQKAHKGNLKAFDASTYRVGIVVAQFNADITNELLKSALAAAKLFTLKDSYIEIHRVAGSVEIPVLLSALAQTKKFDALVALGAIVRGETDHYVHVARMVSDGVLAVMLTHGVPVGFGVLTCDTVAQAVERLDSGAGALTAALHTAHSIRSINGKKS